MKPDPCFITSSPPLPLSLPHSHFTHTAHVFSLYIAFAIVCHLSLPYFGLISRGNHASCWVAQVSKTVWLEILISAYTPWINRWRDTMTRSGKMLKIRSCLVSGEVYPRRQQMGCRFEFWTISVHLLWPAEPLLPCQCQVGLISLLASYILDMFRRQ